MSDDLVDLADAGGGFVEPPADLVDLFARADPSLVDMTGVDKEGKRRFTAVVTKLLDFKTTRSDPKAKQALRTEGRALADCGTWNEATVQELEELLAEVRKSSERIHICQLLGICSIKHYGMPAARYIY